MSSSTFDYIATVWADQSDHPIDWDAMHATVPQDGDHDQGNADEMHDSIEQLKRDWSDEMHDCDVAFFWIRDYQVMQGYDRGWDLGALDECGALDAGGFYR